jgi:hypothetical protein
VRWEACNVQVGGSILKTSLGNFCDDSVFSSAYDCGYECRIPTSLREEFDILDQRTPEVEGGQCPIQPCPTQDKAGGAQALCCTLDNVSSRSETKDKPVPVAHVWIWCVVGMLLISGWITTLQYLQQRLSEAGNQMNINVSQYAVMLSNVGDVECDDQRLEDFGRFYGDVVAAFFVRNFGRYLSLNAKVRCGRCSQCCSSSARP